MRGELARVYRLAKSGGMPWEVAARAAYVLTAIWRMLDSATLDQLAERIAALECAQHTARAVQPP